MKNVYKILALIIFTNIAVTGIAQSDFIGYDMSSIPQSLSNNPATKPNAKFFMGLPVISNINISYFNSSFSFNDIFVTKQGSDSLYLDLNQLAHNGALVNYISQNATIDIFSFGFKVGKAFLSFGINTNFNTRIFYNSDLVKMAWEGNGSYINDDLVLSNTGVFENHFNKYYAGISIPVSNFLRIGLRGNFLQGLSTIYSVNKGTVFSTKVSEDDGVYFEGSTNLEINTSALTYFANDSATLSIQDYFLNFNNSGLSFDIGINVKITDNFYVQLSAVDIGHINWNSYNKTYSSKVDNIYFNGIDYNISDNDSDQDPLEEYISELDSIFNLQESVKKFSTKLRTKIFGNIQYLTSNQKHRFNVLFAGKYLENCFEYALSAGYTFNPFGRFSAKINYTYMKSSPLNLGAGFSINFKPFQFYITANNVLGMVQLDKTRFIDLRVGFNILIPERRKKEEVFDE